MSKGIIIGEGINEVKFGMSKEEVVDFVGKADEVETDDSDKKMIIENWHYDELGLSLSFDKECDWKLTTVAISQEGYLLGGLEFLGMDKKTLAEAVKEKFLSDVSALALGDNQEIVSSEALNIDFYFDNGTCVEIQWGPLFDEDENIIWAD